MSLIRNQEWASCVDQMEAWRDGDSKIDGAQYRAAFDMLVEGLKSSSHSKIDGFDVLGTIMRLIPFDYDVDQILVLIETVDNRPCSFQPICNNPDCSHVTIGDLPL